MTNIDYNGYKINLAEYGEYKETVCKRGKKKGELRIIKKAFWYITDFPCTPIRGKVILYQRRLLDRIKKTERLGKVSRFIMRKPVQRKSADELFFYRDLHLAERSTVSSL